MAPMQLLKAVSLIVSGCSFLCTLVLISAPQPLQAQRTIHQYADAAACQMGGRLTNYLPSGIMPGGNRIPITWNQKEIVWDATGTGEFKVMDGKDLKSIGTGFPEPGAAGPITNPTATGGRAGPGDGPQLRCDHFPYVSPSCTPDQFIREVYQGSC